MLGINGGLSMGNIGIDIGGTKIALGYVENGEILIKKEYPNNSRDGVDAFIDKLCQNIESIITENKLIVSLIGAGCPGGVRDDTIYGAVNLGIDDLPLGKLIENRTGIISHVENDASAAVFGEMLYGSLKNCANGAMITLGTGIGGGIIINRKIYRGSHEAGGEFGHFVYKRGGIKCACGRYGCWEKYASASALVQYAKENFQRSQCLRELCGDDEGMLNGKIIFRAVSLKDAVAVDILDQYTDILADGIIDIQTIFDFDTITLGGGLTGAGEMLIKPVSEKVNKWNDNVAIKISMLGNDAGLIGASQLPILEEYK